MTNLSDNNTASSLSEIFNLAKQIKDNFGQGIPEEVWYRGNSSYKDKLQPRVFRDNLFKDNEFRNYTRFMNRSQSYISYANRPDHDNALLWMPVMQHYGFPTRLLDWTESLLVAIYFSVYFSPGHHDSSIWVLSPYKLNKIEIENDNIPSFRTLPYRDDENERLARDFAYNIFIERKNVQKVVSIYGNNCDSRMDSQKAAFTLHGDEMSLQDHPKKSEFLGLIRIKHEKKLDIAKEVSNAGFTLTNIFPDLSHLAEEIQSEGKMGGVQWKTEEVNEYISEVENKTVWDQIKAFSGTCQIAL